MSRHTISKEAGELLTQLSNMEKATLCTGLTFWDLNGVERLGLPSIMVAEWPPRTA